MLLFIVTGLFVLYRIAEADEAVTASYHAAQVEALERIIASNPVQPTEEGLVEGEYERRPLPQYTSPGPFERVEVSPECGRLAEGGEWTWDTWGDKPGFAVTESALLAIILPVVQAIADEAGVVEFPKPFDVPGVETTFRNIQRARADIYWLLVIQDAAVDDLPPGLQEYLDEEWLQIVDLLGLDRDAWTTYWEAQKSSKALEKHQ